jgi:hypothetical protein
MTDPLPAIAARHRLRGRNAMAALADAYRAGSEARAAHRRPGGGRPRYGELPGEAEVLRELTAMVAMSYSIAAIADELNRRGMFRRGGKLWTVRAVRDVVRAAS